MSSADVYIRMVNDAVAAAGVEAEKISGAIGKKGGWLAAIAANMGKASGMIAARVTALSAAIADNANGAGQGSDKEQAKNAATGMALNAQFQAASQELSYTNNAFSTAIKSLGEALTTMARKQC